MARTRAMPPGAPFGGKKAPPFSKGKGKRTAPAAALPPPPPRPRAAGSTPNMRRPPVPQPPGNVPPPATPVGPLGPAMAAGVGASPLRRAMARGMRTGRMPF